ncbi:MAG: hypothetical protein GQ569_00740 [Methylococcaceae bacterium]|nr:hypothetical protein [Methylococcaceae bacterium]
MKIKTLILSAALSIFAANSYATNVDDWVYKEVTGNLKSSAGCKVKEVAMKSAVKPVRWKKYTKLLCQNIAYGWTLDKVLDKGTIACDECGGDFEGMYRCHAENVKVMCKQVTK